MTKKNSTLPVYMRNKIFGFTPVERSPSGKMTLKEEYE